MYHPTIEEISKYNIQNVRIINKCKYKNASRMIRNQVAGLVSTETVRAKRTVRVNS